MSDTPKTLATRQQIPPTAYVIELKTVHCTNCNTNHEYSDAYELRIYRNFKNLTPVRTKADLNFNMPIHVDRRGPSLTAMCHECVKQGMLSHLPKPPRAEFLTQPATKGPNAPRATKVKEPKTLTIDDLD